MLPSFSEEIHRLLKILGLPPDTQLSTPPKPEMGDWAIPCFSLAKEHKKNPVELARELAVQAQKLHSELFIKIEAQGPFLNVTFATPVVARLVIEAINKNTIITQVKKSERVMIEYSQPNTHKEFHIGHLRNVCIGSTMVNVFKTLGYETISANYIGDIGAHVAKCLWYIKKYRSPELTRVRDEVAEGGGAGNRGKWLGEMYVEASQKIDADPSLKEEVGAVQRYLEDEKTNEWIELWKETRAWSLHSFDVIYKILGTTFDYVFYESEVEKPGKKIVQELLDKGIAQKGEGGAVIVDLASYGLEVCIILKSDGSSLYATKDLALAKKKFEDLAIDRSIYIVDNRQRLYFNQLFKILELLGWKKEMFFLGYEFVTLPDGAMASRKGNVVLFSDLFTDVFESILAETSLRHPEWDEALQSVPTVRTLALAAIKFGMLKHPAEKIIVFNKKEATSVEGFSGPYVLYAVARMNSVLRKAVAQGMVFKSSALSNLMHPTEKSMLLMIAGYGAVLEKTQLHYNPSIIAKYSFDLAQSFNDWYAQCPIISSDLELTHDRLVLVSGVKTVLTSVLAVLGIETVEEM